MLSNFRSLYIRWEIFSSTIEHLSHNLGQRNVSLCRDRRKNSDDKLALCLAMSNL